MQDGILTIIATIAAVVGAVPVLSKAYKLYRPITVQVAIQTKWEKGGGVRDIIIGRVVNRKSEPVYITSCSARCTYPLSIIIKRHLKHPLTPPRLYQNIRFSAPSFNMMKGEKIKVDCFEPVDLTHELNPHFPLSRFASRKLIVEVKLSTGKVVRSKKIDAPERLMFDSIRKSASMVES